jgi:hypothetical protein
MGEIHTLIVSSALYKVAMAGSSVDMRWGCSNFLSCADSEDKKWLSEFDKSDTRTPLWPNWDSTTGLSIVGARGHYGDHQSKNNTFQMTEDGLSGAFWASPVRAHGS